MESLPSPRPAGSPVRPAPCSGAAESAPSRTQRVGRTGTVVAGRRRIAIAAFLLIAVFGAGGAALARGRARYETDGTRHAVVDAGLRYEFNAILGTEVLLDVTGGTPWADVTSERPDAVERLRRKLMEKSGAGSLDDLRAVHRDRIEALRKLGYL